MEVIHLSDLHFGSASAPFCEILLSNALSGYIKTQTNDPFIVFSGDITIRGVANGYKIATKFIKTLLANSGIAKEKLIFCPGNHDIVDKSFNSFDAFVYGVRRDHRSSFRNSSYVKLFINNTLFLLLNSSFHLNHKFGLVDSACFSEDLAEYADCKKVLVLHHHILNQFESDTSAIRNAYDLVKYIDNNQFSVVLHGHQHTDQRYHLGKNSIPIFSARSGNFQQSGYLNAFNHYRFDNSEILVDCLAFERSSSGIEVKRIGEL